MSQKSLINTNRTVSLQAEAFSKFLRISPLKVRLILQHLEGLSLFEACLLLDALPTGYKARVPILKVLWSAHKNFKDKYKFTSIKNVFIKEARCDQGPTMKRFRPRAQGRGFPIQKQTSHITIVVEASFAVSSIQK